MPKLVDWLMENMSCKRFTRHVASEQPLEGGVYRRIHFWVHWAICPFCRRYWAEIRALGELHRKNARLDRHPALKLPEIKNRIRSRLKERLS